MLCCRHQGGAGIGQCWGCAVAFWIYKNTLSKNLSRATQRGIWSAMVFIPPYGVGVSVAGGFFLFKLSAVKISLGRGKASRAFRYF